MFRSVTGHLPPEVLRDEIATRLGPRPDGRKLSACYQEWLRRGYKQYGLGWLDWYETGIPPGWSKPNEVTETNSAEPERKILRKGLNE